MQPNHLDVQPIELDDLTSVRGGFGALLGALLQSAPGILQGVGSIIAASKSGGAPAAPAAPPAAAQPPAQPAAAASTTGGSPGVGACCAMPSMGSMMQMVQLG